jgi:hypothetical protein
VASGYLAAGRRMPPVENPAAVGGYASRCTQTTSGTISSRIASSCLRASQVAAMGSGYPRLVWSPTSVGDTQTGIWGCPGVIGWGKLSGYVLTSECGKYTECEHCDG